MFNLVLVALSLLSEARAAPPLGVPCAQTATEEQLEGVLGRADLHFASLETDALMADLREADGLVACMDAVLSPKTAAHLHRAHGLALELAGDTDGRQRAFAAAMAADPSYRFPPAVLAPKNPVARAYLASSSLDQGLSPVPAPAPDVALFWDGTEGARRPTALPTVFQVRMGPEHLVYSGLLLPSDPLPGYPQPVAPDALAALENPDVPPVQMPTEAEARRAKLTRVSLLAGGGGLVLASGGLVVGALANREEFNKEFLGDEPRSVSEPDVDTEAADTFWADIAHYQNKQRVLVGGAAASGLLGAAALTLGVTWSW